MYRFFKKFKKYSEYIQNYKKSVRCLGFRVVTVWKATTESIRINLFEINYYTFKYLIIITNHRYDF